MDIKKIVFIINLLLCGFIFADDSSVKKALVKVYAAHQMGRILIRQRQDLL